MYISGRSTKKYHNNACQGIVNNIISVSKDYCSVLSTQSLQNSELNLISDLLPINYCSNHYIWIKLDLASVNIQRLSLFDL